MADQKRWFKVWTSILSDDDFDPQRQGSELAIMRFTMLGAYMAQHGNRGTVEIYPDTLFRLLKAHDLRELRATSTLKSVLFEEGKSHYGKITVTWGKWYTYQEDSSASERGKTLRSKRREEEKRKDKIREEEKEVKEKEICERKAKPPSTNSGSSAKVLDSEWLEGLKKNPAYQDVDVLKLYHKMLAWCELKGKKPTRARLLNWLNREEVPMKAAAQIEPSKPAARKTTLDAFREILKEENEQRRNQQDIELPAYSIS